MELRNAYADDRRAAAYDLLEFPNTYHLAFRDLPSILCPRGGEFALDFGCGTGRSTRFLKGLGFRAVGVDIAAEMVARARLRDPAGDYRVVGDRGLGELPEGAFAAVLCAFTFDNVPAFERKVRLFSELRRLLAPGGVLVNLVSSPELYTHDWASFTTSVFTENKSARDGDVVRTIITDTPDARPVEDVLWTDEAYREVFRLAGLEIEDVLRPLARGDEPFAWVNETEIAPWTIYVLRDAAADRGEHPAEAQDADPHRSTEAKRSIPLFQVDAFTSELFRGNPAAVCLLDSWLPDDLLQSIAAENNLSETAFVVRGEGGYEIRWFTPALEIDLCGHATLASAHVLFGRSSDAEVFLFSSRSGPLRVRRDGARLQLDFPALPPAPTRPVPALAEALGEAPAELHASRSYMAVFASEAQVRALCPDMTKLAALDKPGVIVTAPGSDCDFVSRYFAPAKGVPEDPVTGSAHCTLSPYWAARIGKTSLHARQVSRRGGELFCTLAGDRVLIAGYAVTYLEGTIRLPGGLWSVATEKRTTAG